ncbi:hypothetical protein AGMMS49975_00600 [Clostridia bacterium]|nr:hypothetical protein AGMMS49975_00600 [Clostridia bacterium]
MNVFAAFLKIVLRKPRFALFLLTAAALTLFASLVGSGELYTSRLTDSIDVLVVDGDKTTETQMMTAVLEDYSGIMNIRTLETEQEARDEILKNNAAAALLLPKGFSDGIKNGANIPFKVLLNEKQPVKMTLLKYFSFAFADMLAAAQSGVYASLDYVKGSEPAEFDTMFNVINMRFLSLVINRADMFYVTEVSPTDSISVAAHYAVSFWIFLNVAGIILFADIVSGNFSRRVIVSLKLSGFGAFKFAAGLTAGFFALFFAANFAAAFIVLKGMPVYVLVVLLVSSFALSALASFILLLFKNPQAASVAATVLAGLGLFLSGGIIPREFLANSLARLSPFTINYYIYNLSILGKTDITQSLIIILIGGLFFSLTVLVVRSIQKGGICR